MMSGRDEDAAASAAAALPPPAPGAETTPTAMRSTRGGAPAPAEGTVAVGINPNQLTQVFAQAPTPSERGEDAAAPAATAPPLPSPDAETTPRANRSTGGGAPTPPVGTVAVGTRPNQLTTNLPGASPSAGGSVVSELSMSVGAPRAGARVSNTPATTARRPARARAGQAPGTRPPPAPKCKVGARVVVERKHLHYRVKPQEPARAVLDQHNHQNYNFYGHVKSKAKHDTWRVVFDLFPADQAPLDVARSHIKKVLRPDEEAPAYDREQESAHIIRHDDVRPRRRRGCLGGRSPPPARPRRRDDANGHALNEGWGSGAGGGYSGRGDQPKSADPGICTSTHAFRTRRRRGRPGGHSTTTAVSRRRDDAAGEPFDGGRRSDATGRYSGRWHAPQSTHDKSSGCISVGGRIRCVGAFDVRRRAARWRTRLQHSSYYGSSSRPSQSWPSSGHKATASAQVQSWGTRGC